MLFELIRDNPGLTLEQLQKKTRKSAEDLLPALVTLRHMHKIARSEERKYYVVAEQSGSLQQEKELADFIRRFILLHPGLSGLSLRNQIVRIYKIRFDGIFDYLSILVKSGLVICDSDKYFSIDPRALQKPGKPYAQEISDVQTLSSNLLLATARYPGKSPRELFELLSFIYKVKCSPGSVQKALSRLVERNLLSRREGHYFEASE